MGEGDTTSGSVSVAPAFTQSLVFQPHLTGTVSISKHTVYNDYIADDLLFDIDIGEVMALTGTDVFNNDALALGGTLRNFGSLTIDDGLTLETTVVTLANASSLTQDADIATASTGGAVLMRNLSGATWTLAANVSINAGEQNSTFANFGTLQLTLDQDATIGGTFDNYATVALNGGVLNLTGDSLRFLGQITGPGSIVGDDVVLNGTSISGTNLDFNEITLKGDVTDTGNFGESYTLLKMVDSTLTLPGATSIGESLSVPPVTFAGTVFGTGQIDLDSHVDIAGLTLEGRAAGAPNLTNDDYVTQGATTEGGTPNPIVALNPIDNQTITITNGSGGALWITGSVGGQAAALTSTDPAHAFFDNYGVFQNDSSLPTVVGVTFVNNGFAEGRFIFDDAITGSGFLEFGDTLTLNASVSSGQYVEFVSSGATLTLGDVQDFAATISSFDTQGRSSDAIVVNSSQWSFAGYVPHGGDLGSIGSLMFSNGASEVGVTLEGSYSASGFQAVVSGNHTTITYTPPSG
jgi:hypothetical protein